ELAINPTTGAVTGEVPGSKEVTGYDTDGAVGLQAFRGALFMSFVGDSDDVLYMDVKDTRGSKNNWGPNAFDTGVKSVEDIIPFLTPYPPDKQAPDQVLKVSWIDDDDH